MELFRISCTTCKARLNVRDPKLVGQILPCPKCGSMVLVTAPTIASGPAEPSAAVTASPSDVNSSFENIESFLDDNPQPTEQPTPSPQRWRDSENDAARVPQDSESVPSEPVAESQALLPEAAPNDGSTVAEPDYSPVEPTATSSLSMNYGVVFGGGMLGLAMALGVAGFFILRSSGDSTQIVNEDQSTGAKQEFVADSSDSESVSLAGDENSSDANTISADDIDASSLAVEDSPLEEPTNPEIEGTAESTAESTAEMEESFINDSLFNKPPESDLSNVEESPSSFDETSTTEAANNSQIDLADDGLAGFSRWLQSPESFGPDPNVEESLATAAQPVTRRQTTKPVIQPTRPIPAKVDLEQRLQDEIIALEFPQMTLSNALRILSDYSTIPITLSPEALSRRNLSASKRITLPVLESTTVAEALGQILSPLRLAYLAEEGQLVITTLPTSKHQLVEMEHEVGDLCSGDARKTAFFFDWLTGFVAPESWESRGGQGSGEAEGTKLKILQDDLVHYQILEVCEKLRVARGLPPRSRIKPELLALTQKSEQLSESQRPITLHVWRESNLNTIAAEIERTAGINVLIDWQALHHAGWSPRDTMRFICQDEPFDSALQNLLNPMGLNYRVVDHSTIQITSEMVYSNNHEIEFYRLRNPNDFRQLSQQVMEQVGINRFQPQGTGVITYDNPSGCLIVSLAQPDHEIVQAVLGDAVN